MAGVDVTTVYRSVIDEVITKSRPEFVQEGVDEAVLEELRVLWEEKLQQTGVLTPEPARPMPGGLPGSQIMAAPYSQPPNQQVMMYYPPRGQPSQIGRPQAYLGSSSAPWQTHSQVPTSAPGGQVAVPVVQTGAQPTQSTAQRPQFAYPHQVPQAQALRPQGAGSVSGYPQSFQQQPAQYQSQPPAYQQPQYHQQQYQVTQQPQQQQYAAGQSYQQALGQPPPSMSYPGQGLEQADPSRKRPAEPHQGAPWPKNPNLKQEPYRNIPQQDGTGDEGEEEGGEKDKEEEAAVDNLSDVPSSDDEDEEVPNHCISQFTKVQRTKNRWKCQLVGGILHLNGRDHVFNSASGEFQF